MSSQGARTIVLVTAGLMFAAIGLKRATIADPFRYAWAAGVITLGLSALADIAPEVAGPAALLVLTAVYFKNASTLNAVLPKPGAAPAKTGPTPASQSPGPR